ncbi:hypothetical protein [Stakelama tenebrarum]|uniref:Uncharacterized protein n=1 Tax=Stakelama tenebrarum TaxID=2711215 RepID=A0A6G6Y664_9SPHN|nr:hypothetical protein [Sphingosinithalassobacter tenebrarum]QIG80073.1 hypothetical protein G5C33_09975 [Sphingosinithalassobacter tenebrarum]
MTDRPINCTVETVRAIPDNWTMIPRAMLPRLNGRFGRNYDAAPTDLKPTILAIAELEHRAREARSPRSQSKENARDDL